MSDVFKFLLGEGPLDGAWFGERPKGERGDFWWRKHLRAEVERLMKQCEYPADGAGAIRAKTEDETIELCYSVCKTLSDTYGQDKMTELCAAAIRALKQNASQ